MDGLHVFLLVFLGVVSCSHDQIPGSVSEVTVRPGDNITLHCDCKPFTGQYIVWYRNCSHENQPSLVLNTRKRYPNEDYLLNPKEDYSSLLNPFPRFHLVYNNISKSYDLLIINITAADEGLYYCGTKQTKVEETNEIYAKEVYRYGNVTKIVFGSTEPPHIDGHCGDYWMLLVSLCPACSVLSSLLSSLLVYHLCKQTAKKPQAEENRLNTGGQTSLNQDEDVCYAAVEIRRTRASQRPKQKKVPSSDFCTYSAINTSRV